MSPPDILSKAGRNLLKYKYLLLVALVGLVLLVWPKSKDPPQVPSPPQEQGIFDLRDMEQRLARTLSSVSGVGNIEVMLTLKTDMEVVTVQDPAAYSKRETVNYPAYQGALIVCDGAWNAKVKTEVLDAVTALTGLRGNSVIIAGRQK